MKIGVIVVTYNRRQLLEKTLEAYEKQTLLPEYIIVVNNCSVDDTAEFLDTWKTQNGKTDRIVITLAENLGGSGGFYSGEKKAIELGAEWIWHADDDAVPDVNALQELANAYNNMPNQDRKKIVALCPSIRFIDNINEDITNRKCLKKGLFYFRWIDAEQKNGDDVYVDRFTYLGATIRKAALLEVGLTRKSFFIHEDDVEHACRLRKIGKILSVNDSIIMHPKWDEVTSKNKLNWKYYYTVRNHILTVKYNFEFRYRLFVYFKEFIKLFIHFIMLYPNRILKEEFCAIVDAIRCREGIHPVYKP